MTDDRRVGRGGTSSFDSEENSQEKTVEDLLGSWRQSEGRITADQLTAAWGRVASKSARSPSNCSRNRSGVLSETEATPGLYVSYGDIHVLVQVAKNTRLLLQ
jgi:hypothetical protein